MRGNPENLYLQRRTLIMDNIMRDATEAVSEGIETTTEEIVDTVADQDIMNDIDVKNAKTLVIAGITILIIGTTIYIVKNKGKFKTIKVIRLKRKHDRLIAKLNKLEHKLGEMAVDNNEPDEDEYAYEDEVYEDNDEYVD
jgi:hypothetical protein